jgi:uncharacterized delta-60 repeat protein
MNRKIGPRRPSRQRPSVETLEGRTLLTLAGGINPTFASTGSVAFPVLPPGSPATATATGTTLSAVGANGEVVLAGTVADSGMGYFTVVVFNANGTPDTTFGGGGQVSFPVGSVSTAANTQTPEATSLVVRPDGTIDVGGTLSSPTATTNSSYGVIQITPSGTLDQSFGNQGIATLPTFAPNNQPYYSLSAMTLTTSGQLVVVGEAESTSTTIELEMYAARFNTSGTLDTTFGTSGVAQIPISVDDVTQDQATAVAVQSSGRIVVAGYASGGMNVTGQSSPDFNLEDGLLVGLTPSGNLDPTFGGGSSSGEVILRPDPTNPSALGNRPIVALTFQPDGKIVLAGTDAILPSGSTTLPTAVGQLTRLSADGVVDASFGNSGTVSFTNGLTPYGVTVQSNGLILVPGSTLSSSTFVASVARYNSDGTPDATFGSASTPGLATFTASGAQGLLMTASINSKGQIILGGELETLNSDGSAYVPNFVVIQVYPIIPVESEPSSDYDGSGKSNIAVYVANSGAFAYQPTNGSANVVVPFGLAGIGQTIPAPGDYDGSGKTEIAAYLPSLGIYAYRPANGGADVVESFGIAGTGQSIPVPGDYFGTGVDDIAVYLPSVGSFAIRNPLGGPDEIIPFGFAGAGQTIPAPGDYFGTGQTDIAAYLPSLGAFAIRNPTTGVDEFIPFGIAGTGNTIPIPGNYDGSGVTELAVYLPKLGKFAYRPATGGADVILSFGTAGDGSIPTPGDYTGVGFDEIGIYDPLYASFAYRPATGGADVIESFGSPGQGFTLPLTAPVYSNVPTVHGSTLVPLQSVSATGLPGGSSALSASSVVRIASTRPAQADPSKPADDLS